MYHNCASLCSLREGKEGAKTIYISLAFMNYRIKTKMLLIILLGLFTTLTSVSGDCDVGSQGMRFVNFCKIVGTWYLYLHTPNDFNNNFECVVATFVLLEENIGLVTVEAFDISEGIYKTFHGNATNFTNTTFDLFYQEPTIWTARHYFIPTDYNNYLIFKQCSFVTNQLYDYVGFRSNRPDRATLLHVGNELRKNDIDIRQLVVWPTGPCQQAESSTEE